MGSMDAVRPHAVCVPYPAQGHVTPMLKVAKLLHSHGFHITFVNTEFNHARLVRSRGPSAVEGLPDFRFETIPDSLPPSDLGATQDVPSLCDSVTKNFLSPFRDLLARLNDTPSSSVPPVTCVVGDGVMSFTIAAAKEIGVPAVTFYTTSAVGFQAYLHYPHLIQRGLVPLKDMDDVKNGYLMTPIDWVPGLKNMRLRDFPSFIRTTDMNDIMLNFMKDEAQRDIHGATAIILNTFYDLEHHVLDAMASSTNLPPLYTIGPLRFIPDSPLASIRSSLWCEDSNCMKWLDKKHDSSVVFVNFGSITTMTKEELVEFAWGLANSGYSFLWVTRPDLVMGDAAALPPEFLEETEGRAMITSWCAQEEVLSHSAVGVFLTHNGWNSTIESISGGVPMLCWPFFAEQQTNCRYVCTEWGNGMEVEGEVRREVVEGLIREAMDGEKGEEMRRKAREWKEKAIRVTAEGGSSWVNFEKVVNEVLRPRKI